MVRPIQVADRYTRGVGENNEKGGEKMERDPSDAIASLMRQAAAWKKAQREVDTEAGASADPVRKKAEATVSKKDQILTEWGLYKADNVSEDDVDNTGGTLAWWAKAQVVYPHIARLARKYLAVQASAASESVFSVRELVVTKHRNHLGGERVADIVFLHESMKHNIW